MTVLGSPPGDPVLGAVVQAAVEVTGASGGWLLAVEGDVLRVVAGAGTDGAGATPSVTVPAGSGAAGFVAASGQPLAVSPRGDDPRFGQGMAALLGRQPTSILAVPCLTEGAVVGVLELVDKAGGGSFSFDDVELATLLAGIAAVGMASPGGRPAVPDPSQLGGDLGRLATSEPARYAVVAVAVAALLADG